MRILVSTSRLCGPNLHSWTPSADKDMNNEQKRDSKPDADMNPARPRSQHVGSEVIEPERGQDEYAIAGNHEDSGGPISPPSPTTPDVQRNKRA